MTDTLMALIGFYIFGFLAALMLSTSVNADTNKPFTEGYSGSQVFAGIVLWPLVVLALFIKGLTIFKDIWK